MDIQVLLQQEASARGLSLTSLSRVSSLSTSQKIPCCGGVVEKIVAESAQDCTLLMRDTTGSIHCAIHGAVSSRYPDALAIGALLLFCDVTVLITSSIMPPILIVCLEHLAALLLPEASGEAGGKVTDGAGASSSYSWPLVELMTNTGSNLHDFRKPAHYDVVVDESLGESCLGAAAPTVSNITLPTDTIIPAGIDDDEDCLQFADDL